MIFQDNVEFTLEVPLRSDGKTYEHILMGEKMGHLVLKN